MDWEAFRDEFPVTRHWAFLAHAAVAPPSGRASRTLIEWASDMAEHGLAHESRWAKRVEDVRRLAARFIGADPLDVAFIKNTSEGVGIVAEGFPWRPGDNVVIAAEEYPANVYPWMNLADRGVGVRRVESRERRVWVDDVRAAVDGRTRIVSLSSVEFSSGFRNDLDTVGALCRERGTCFFVDAIQSLGVLPLDVRRTPIDFLAADGHKWLLGPEGAGLFYIRQELVERLHPVGVGWNSVVAANEFTRIDFRLKPHAGRWESGALNVGGIAALGASIDLLIEVGVEVVWDRVRELTEYLCERAERAGCDVYSSRRPGDRSGIVSLTVPGVDVPALVRRCREAGVMVNHRAGRVRVSPHCYNNRAELDRLVELLRPAPQ
jgi:selenocysteine lyase/cysteine desulfurase